MGNEVKSKATLSIPSRTWERAKREYPNASERITELLEADLDVSESDDKSIVKNKIQELQEKKESLEEEHERIQRELNDVESELSASRSTLERLKREEEEVSADLGRFKEVFAEKRSDGDWKDPDRIPKFWVKETGKSKEELFKIGEKADVEPQVKKV